MFDYKKQEPSSEVIELAKTFHFPEHQGSPSTGLLVLLEGTWTRQKNVLKGLRVIAGNWSNQRADNISAVSYLCWIGFEELAVPKFRDDEASRGGLTMALLLEAEVVPKVDDEFINITTDAILNADKRPTTARILAVRAMIERVVNAFTVSRSAGLPAALAIDPKAASHLVQARKIICTIAEHPEVIPSDQFMQEIFNIKPPKQPKQQ